MSGPAAAAAAALREGRLADAAAQLEAVLRQPTAQPDLVAAIGYACQQLGDAPAAIRAYRAALVARPGDLPLSNNLANQLAASGALEEAEALLREAAERDPRSAATRVNLGLVLQQQGRSGEAEACYREALTLDPAGRTAHANLAALLEAEHRREEAQQVAREGLAQHPEHAALSLILARCLADAGDLAAAVATLEPVAGPALAAGRPDPSYELAQLLERRGEHGRAWSLMCEANRAVSEELARRGGLSDGAARIREVIERLPELPAIPGSGAVDAPLFVVGHPRSGTTLVDRMLAAHPELVVLTEHPLIEARQRELGGSYPERLATLSEEELADARRTYLEGARALMGGAIEGTLVDEMPLNALRLALIARIFPGARVLHVQRHPCDVVTSCLFQSFGATRALRRGGGLAAAGNFLDLRSAASYYAAVMDAIRAQTERYGIELVTLRYEDLIADPEAALHAACAALELSFHPAMLDHAAVTRAGGQVRTPSNRQVAQPLYRHACGRWQGYREQLAPILEQLAPYCRMAGYPDPCEATA